MAMTNEPRRGDTPHGRQHYSITLAVLAVAALAFALLQTMIVPALPDMQRALGTSTTSITWVLTIYLLTASIATPVVGRLGDIFGKEHTLLAVLGVFALGSVLCAISQSLGLLIVGRAIQGAGGAIFPLSFGIIRDEFPRERVATGIGLISATFGIGGGAGLVLSGFIVDHFSFEWIFWLGLVMTVIAMVTTYLFVPESPIKSPARIDWVGAVLLSGGLVCLLLAVSEANAWGWYSAGIVSLAAGAALLFLGWGWFELRSPEPLVDIRLLRQRPVWTTNVAGLLVGFGMFGSFLLIPQFVRTPALVGYGFGATVIGAGIFLLPAAGVMLIAGPLAGILGTRFGSRLPLQLGALITAAAFGLLTVAHSEPWQIYTGSAMLGVGIGFAFASMANLVVDAVPAGRTGEATGINTIMRTVGGALGAQIAASIISAHIAAGARFPSEDGYTVAFFISCLTLLVAFAASLAIPRRNAPEAATLTPMLAPETATETTA